MKLPLSSIHTNSVDFNIFVFPKPPRIQSVPFGNKILEAYARAVPSLTSTSQDPLPSFPLGLYPRHSLVLGPVHHWAPPSVSTHSLFRLQYLGLPRPMIP